MRPVSLFVPVELKMKISVQVLKIVNSFVPRLCWRWDRNGIGKEVREEEELLFNLLLFFLPLPPNILIMFVLWLPGQEEHEKYQGNWAPLLRFFLELRTLFLSFLKTAMTTTHNQSMSWANFVWPFGQSIQLLSSGPRLMLISQMMLARNRCSWSPPESSFH